MAKLEWDKVGERFFEAGVDRGVLYLATNGIYDTGYAWNGLTAVTESPSGAEANAQYADNMKYINLISAEEFGCTIEAFTYPSAFGQCDGSAEVEQGVYLGQQSRRPFGFSYRTLIGNDLVGTDLGYKIHLVYNAQAAPSERSNGTVNDSPEAMTLSWEVTTTPAQVGVIGGKSYRATAHITIDSTKADPTALAALETILYGSAGVDPRLPAPADVVALFAGAITVVTPASPTFVKGTGVITIVPTTGVTYRRADTGAIVTTSVTIATPGDSLVITAAPNAGYVFSPTADDDWSFTRDV